MNHQFGTENREKALLSRIGRAALVTITLYLMHGCATTRVEQNRQAITGIAADEAMVILGRATYNDRQTEESFTDCLEDILSSGDRPIRLVPQQEFIDQMYPWFEPRTAPGSASDLGQLFMVPGVQEKIADSKVVSRLIEGDTVTIDKGGSMSCTVSTFGGGCFGMSYWEQDASYEASIWDVQTLDTTGQISADANGHRTSGLVVLPILARPGNAACKGLAEQLRTFISGD